MSDSCVKYDDIVEYNTEVRMDIIGRNGNDGLHYDSVHQPKHYELWEGVEVIDIIRTLLTSREFKGYCKGNMLKYRLRAGKKGDTIEDIEKASVYEEWLSSGQ